MVAFIVRFASWVYDSSMMVVVVVWQNMSMKVLGHPAHGYSECWNDNPCPDKWGKPQHTNGQGY